MSKMSSYILAFLVFAGLPIAYVTSELYVVTAKMSAFNKIQHANPAMRIDEVTALLGKPLRIDQAETTGVEGLTYYFPDTDQRVMRIVFVNGTVFHADYLPLNKS